MLLPAANPPDAPKLIFLTLDVRHLAEIAVLAGSIARVDLRIKASRVRCNRHLLALLPGSKAHAAPRLPAPAKLAESLSLLLWLGLVIAGRGIGSIHAPFDIHASASQVL